MNNGKRPFRKGFSSEQAKEDLGEGFSSEEASVEINQESEGDDE